MYDENLIFFPQLRRASTTHSIAQCKCIVKSSGEKFLCCSIELFILLFVPLNFRFYFPALEIHADTVQEFQEAKITNYEEALAKIKDATGVSDIQEVVDRFLNQGDTKRHLERLREENTRQVARLKEEKEKLQAQFEDMKYSGEAKTSAYVTKRKLIF